MKIVGFAGRSLAETEVNWEGIELFYFMEDTRLTMVQVAKLWFSPDDQAAQRAWDELATYFGARFEPRKKVPGFVVDGLLSIGLNRNGPSYVFEVEPSALCEWGKEHFDRLREVDKVLRGTGLPVVAKPHAARAFFQGRIV